jgi:hypothetical protein
MLGRHSGIFRVAVIGDSTVAALQVKAEEAFTQFAEWRLGQHFEVMNFGVLNYGLAQQYILLRDRVLAYQPDLVVEAVSLTNATLNSTRATAANASPYPYFVQRGDHIELAALADLPHRNPASETVWLNLENRSDLFLLALEAARAAAHEDQLLQAGGRPAC